MDKDFRTIIILGLIAMLISGIGLYQFRNIKFKNTKKLETTNQENQQEIINQYNNLVDVYIPNITDKVPENNLPTTGEISLIIPGFFNQKDFDNITNKLKQYDINLNISEIDSYQNFKQEIKSNLKKYDIALIPINRMEGLSVQNISLGENIKPYFLPIFNISSDINENNFIPFSIDPTITIYKNISPQDNREKIFSYTLMWKSQKKYAMPILRGFDELTEKILKNNTIPFEYYTEILLLQLKQIKIKNDNQELSNMLNTNNIAIKEKFTYQNFKAITDLLKKQNKYCEIYPATCTIRYGYSDIKFGFMSDFDILNKFFQGDYNLYAGSFTNSENKYPVKGRVFIVPQGNQNTNLTNKFFSEYISQSIDGNDTLWHNTLSAITNIYDTQKTKDIFKNIIGNENNFYIFTGSINLQDQIVNDGKTLEMLKGNYNIKSYLSNFPY